jgi:transcriptional regulator NrdR family protein
MAARGRKPGFVMSDEHRVKIQNSNILNALVEHVEGRREMSSTQVQAGLGLLKKVLPDLQSTEITAEVVATVVSAKPMTAEEWAAQHAVAD